MARVEPVDLKTRLSVSPGGARGASRASAVAAAGAFGSLAQGAQELGEVATNAAQDFAERDAERKYLAAELGYRQFKSDFLYGEKGVMHRNGDDAEGLTDAVGKGIQEYVSSQASQIENGRVLEAFRNFVAKDLIDTTNLAARDEANKLEVVRQSNAQASLNLVFQEAVIRDQTKFLDTMRGGSDEVLADFKETVETRIQTIQPGIGDEAASILADQQIAEHAHQAVFALMDAGASNVDVARNIQTIWQDKWTPQSRSTADARIVDELGFTQMRTTVAQAAANLGGQNFSDKEIADESQRLYEDWHMNTFGKAASSEHIDSVRDRAFQMNTLVDSQLEERRDIKRENALVRFFQDVESGDMGRVLSAYNELSKDAIAANDLELLESLQTMRTNFIDNRGEIFPSTPTFDGLENYLEIRESKRKPTKAETLMLATQLPKDMWEKVGQGTLGQVPAVSAADLAEAVNAANQDKTGKKKMDVKSAEYQLRYARLDVLTDIFAKEQGRKPEPEELRSMARGLKVDLDDSGFDSGFTGTIEGFLQGALSGDTETRLSLSDRNDRRVAEVTALLARSEPQAARIIIDELGLTRGLGVLHPHQINEELLVDQPELAARLIEFGLATNTDLNFEGGAIGFRDYLVRSSQPKNADTSRKTSGPSGRQGNR